MGFYRTVVSRLQTVLWNAEVPYRLSVNAAIVIVPIIPVLRFDWINYIIAHAYMEIKNTNSDSSFKL